MARTRYAPPAVQEALRAQAAQAAPAPVVDRKVLRQQAHWEKKAQPDYVAQARRLAIDLYHGRAVEARPYQLGLVLWQGEVMWAETWARCSLDRHPSGLGSPDQLPLSCWAVTNKRLVGRLASGFHTGWTWEQIGAYRADLTKGKEWCEVVVDGRPTPFFGPGTAPMSVALVYKAHGVLALLEHPGLAALRVDVGRRQERKAPPENAGATRALPARRPAPRAVGSHTHEPRASERPRSEVEVGTVRWLDGHLGTLVLEFFGPPMFELLARSSSDNINAPLRSFDHYPKGALLVEGRNSPRKVLTVGTSEALVDVVCPSEHRRERCEVDEVPVTGRLGRRVRSCFHHQSAQHRRPPYLALQAFHLDQHRLRTVDGLLGAWCPKGRASRSTLASRSALAEAPGDQHVDLRLVSDPTVLMAFRGDAGRTEADLRQRGSELVQDVGPGSHIEYDIAVVGRPPWGDASLGAVEEHHLATDDAPALCGEQGRHLK